MFHYFIIKSYCYCFWVRCLCPIPHSSIVWYSRPLVTAGVFTNRYDVRPAREHRHSGANGSKASGTVCKIFNLHATSLQCRLHEQTIVHFVHTSYGDLVYRSSLINLIFPCPFSIWISFWKILCLKDFTLFDIFELQSRFYFYQKSLHFFSLVRLNWNICVNIFYCGTLYLRITFKSCKKITHIKMPLAMVVM